MSDGFDFAGIVVGDADACRRAATQFHDLAAAVTVAHDKLSDTVAAMSPTWTGDAADACKKSCEALLSWLRDLAADLSANATALTATAEQIDAATTRMKVVLAAAAAVVAVSIVAAVFTFGLSEIAAAVELEVAAAEAAGIAATMRVAAGVLIRQAPGLLLKALPRIAVGYAVPAAGTTVSHALTGDPWSGKDLAFIGFVGGVSGLGGAGLRGYGAVQSLNGAAGLGRVTAGALGVVADGGGVLLGTASTSAVDHGVSGIDWRAVGMTTAAAAGFSAIGNGVGAWRGAVVDGAKPVFGAGEIELTGVPANPLDTLPGATLEADDFLTTFAPDPLLSELPGFDVDDAGLLEISTPAVPGAPGPELVPVDDGHGAVVLDNGPGPDAPVDPAAAGVAGNVNGAAALSWMHGRANNGIAVDYLTGLPAGLTIGGGTSQYHAPDGTPIFPDDHVVSFEFPATA